jgi:hypothetical protein
MSNGPAVISLRTRSLSTANLSFSVDGIIEGMAILQNPKIHPTPVVRPITLGDAVTPFIFENFYGKLNSTPSNDPSLLVYNASGIWNDSAVSASALMWLRAESTKAVLNKAVNSRQNAYFAKYANKQQIITVMQNFYQPSQISAPLPAPASGSSKPDMLVMLSSLAQSQRDALQGSYAASGQPIVVENTTSVFEVNSNTQTTVTNTGYTYRTPAYEAMAQGFRAGISLLDQQFSQFMSNQIMWGQNAGNTLLQVFTNELQNIDYDVMRLQVAYLNTILMSPIPGIITGIYKGPGDYVRAGEPVMRVEDNTSDITKDAMLVGTLMYRGPLSLGSTLTITTSPYNSSGPPTTFQANVVAVRSHRSRNGMWEVHAIFGNQDSSGNPLFPINYDFDYGDTTVVIN